MCKGIDCQKRHVGSFEERAKIDKRNWNQNKMSFVYKNVANRYLRKSKKKKFVKKKLE